MRKKRIYLTGFDNDDELLFGPSKQFTTAFSLNGAKKDIDKFPDNNGVLYKLVKIDPKTLKEIK